MEAPLAKYDTQNDASIKRYTDYKQMLAENDVTLASIATRERYPREIALLHRPRRECHHRKAHGASMDDAEEIVRRSEEKGVKVSAATRTGSMWPSSRCAKLWRPDASAKFPTAPSMCAGTGITATMIRPPGGAPGPRTVAAS